jgi:MOSC domain-containing protein YiiM
MSTVVSVGRSPEHAFSKPACQDIRLLAGIGVEGDAHAGAMVQHLSRREAEPNLRQVHLIQAELLEELDLVPGALGENVTTRGIDLLELSEGTLLHLGDEAVVQLTGLRTPCVQIDRYRAGLLKAVAGRADDGSVVLRAGVMAVVTREGTVRSGDPVTAESPQVFVPMQRI